MMTTSEIEELELIIEIGDIKEDDLITMFIDGKLTEDEFTNAIAFAKAIAQYTPLDNPLPF